MFEHIADLPDPLSRALVVGTASQLLLLGELAPRVAAGAVTRGLATETSPALVEALLAMGMQFADRWAPPDEAPALQAAFADAAMALADDRRCTASRRCARWPARRPPTAHWRVLDEAAAAADDNDLAWRIATRRAELGDYDADAVQRLLDSDPDPDAHTRRLAVLAARPDLESKQEVWDAFFVDYSVPASRETLVLGATFWRPGQSELLAPFAMRYLEELRTLKGGLLNQGLVIRAMYPLGVGDETFLAAARMAADDESLSAYARNQLASNTFVQSGSCRPARTLLAARARPALGAGTSSSASMRRSSSSMGNRSSFCRSMAAPTSPAKSGCGRVGRERSSGCAWVAT